MDQPLYDHEKQLREAFSNKEVTLDVENLWAGLSEHVPTPKKRKNVILPLLILVGIASLIGNIVMGAMLNDLNTRHNTLRSSCTTLSKRLLNCKNQNAIAQSSQSTTGKNTYGYQNNVASAKRVYQSSHKLLTSGSTDKISFRGNKVNNTSPFTLKLNPEDLISDKKSNTNEIQSITKEKISLPLAPHIAGVELKKLVSSEIKPTPEIKCKMVETIPFTNTPQPNWLCNFTVSTGAHHSAYANKNNDVKNQYSFAKGNISHSVSFDINRQLSPRWQIGLGLTHRWDVASINYDYTEKQYIDIIDINQIYIDQNGNLTSSSGLLGGYKISYRKGTSYDIDRRWTLNAILSYKLWEKGNNAIYTSTGIGYDLYKSNGISALSVSNGLLKNKGYIINSNLNYSLGLKFSGPLCKSIYYNIGLLYLRQTNDISLLNEIHKREIQNLNASIGAAFNL